MSFLMQVWKLELEKRTYWKNRVLCASCVSVEI